MRHDVVITSRGFTLIELLVVIAIIARADRAAAAGGAGGARGGPADPVRQQPEAARAGHAQLPRRQQRPARRAGSGRRRPARARSRRSSRATEHALVQPDAAPVRAGEPGQLVQLHASARRAGRRPGRRRFFANSTVAATKISVFQCPSDRNNSFQINPLVQSVPLSTVDLHQGELRRELGQHELGPAARRTDLASRYRQSAFGHRREHQPGQDHRRHEQHGVHRRSAPGRDATTSAA